MHALCEWKGQEKREGGREWKREREREGGRVECYEQERQRSAGWGGRVSTPPRVRAVGGREKERKERERPKLEGLFLCRSFSALNVQDGQIRRGEGVTSGTVYLTVCVHECVRARAPAVSHQPAWWEEHWMPADWGSALSKVCALFLRLC